MTLWKLTVHEIRRRPGRALLTLLSIAIAMAAIVSVALGTATTRKAYQQMYEMVTGRAALEITPDGGGTFSEAIVAEAEQSPGVKAAVPSIRRVTKLWLGQKSYQMLMMGIDPEKDGAARDYDLKEGQFFEKNDDEQLVGLLMEIEFARAMGVHVGDEVVLQTTRGFPHFRKRMKVVGLLAARGAAGFNKGGVVFLPLPLAQKHFARRGEISTIDVVLKDGADENKVAEDLRKRLPEGADVHLPTTRTQLAQQTFLMIELGLDFASVLTAVLAIFIICNTFLMNVSERRRQLAILRAVGATRGQVVRMLLLEGLVMGIAGTVLGCLAGLGGGYLLMDAVTRVFVATPPPVVFTLWPFLLAAVLGPLAAVAAAYVPARLTTGISPLEAMLPLVSQGEGVVSHRTTIVGVILTLLMASLVATSFLGWYTVATMIYFAAGFMASFVLLIPWLVGPMVRLVAWPLAPLLGLAGRLARRQVRRRPTRTGLTVGVLYIAVATGVALGTTIINNVNDFRKWYRQTIVGDFFVRAMMPDTTGGDTVKVPAELADEIREIPGITLVDSLQIIKDVKAADHAIIVAARGFTDPEILPIDLVQGDPETIRKALKRGEVVIGTVLAQYAGVQPGDQITISTAKGERSFRVAGTAIDYLVGGYLVYMQREVAEREFRVEGVESFLVKASPEARPAVGAALEKLCQDHGLIFQSHADLVGMLDRIMEGVVASLWAILVLGFVVAAFGIANTLTMNVLEQTRELALLRVVAMTRWQVRRMVLSQAAIIGIIGLALGVLVGVGAAFGLSWSVTALLGHPVPFALQPTLVIGSFILGLALVLMAASIPAERAARLDLLIALQYE